MNNQNCTGVLIAYMIILIFIFFSFIDNSFLLAQSPFTKLRDLPKAGLSVFNVAGKIYGIASSGNYNSRAGSLYVYDPANDSWEKLQEPNIPEGAGIASANGKLYVISGIMNWTTAGYSCTNTMEVYDPSTNKWSRGDSTFISRALMETAVANGRIYVIGGQHLSSNDYYYGIRTIEEYNPQTKHWSEISILPEGTIVNRVVTLNDSIYLFCPSGTNYIYIPKKDKLEVFEPKMNHRTFDFSVTVNNGKIFVFSGGNLKKLEVYDPAIKIWQEIRELPFENWMQSAVELNGKIYLAGGYIGMFGQGYWSADFYVYDPAKDNL